MAECDNCDRDGVETTPHRVWFFDDREPDDRELCPSCVRELSQDDNPVRSIT